MKEQRKMRISRFINKWVASVMLTVGLSFTICAQEGQVVDGIIAKVDDYIILKSELEASYINFLSSEQARTFDGDARCLILRSFIENKILLAMSEIDSVEISESRIDYELQGRMQRIIQQFGSEQAIQQAYGKSIDQFMDELRPGVEDQLRIKTQESNILSDIEVTPAEIRKFYSRIPKDSLPLYNREYEAGLIAIIPKPSQSEKQKVIDKLIEVRNKILNGADFGIAAIDYSEGPTGPNGGDLGFTSRGMMDPAFEAAALALDKGEISMPIESSFGIHLIQLLERRGNEYHSRHIIIVPKPSQDDMDKAQSFLDSLRNEIIADNISFEEAAKQYSDDQGTKYNGGFISGPYGSNRVPVEALDPSLFFAIDSLDQGQISKPAMVQISPDTKAARIIYFKKEVPPHRANIRDDYEKLKLAATEMKKAQKRDEYLKKKIQEVYIEIDPEYNRCGIIKN